MSLSSLKLTNRTELIAFIHELLEPTKQYRQEGNGRLNFGSTSAHYTDDQGEIEGFLRLLWGIGPLVSQNSMDDFKYYQEGILSGVNPESPFYWGTVHDYDQLIVEMAALAVMLMETKNEFWARLNKLDQGNLIEWLSQINEVDVHKNNWRFFRVLVNVALIKLEQPYSKKHLTKDLEAINEMYLGDGWYFDGNPQQMDYYIPWAFHYYGLIYVKEMAEIDPKQVAIFKERSILFAQNFKYWFDDNGAGVPFGRSLTYRFAQIAFWSALVYADVEALPWGQIKGLIFRHFRYWASQKMTKSDGILSLGYAYENLYLTESYNSPGSPYWSFKSFLILGVDETHPFWQAAEEGIDSEERIYVPEAKMILTNQEQQNVLLYPAAQLTNQAHSSEKYSKFVYSSRFGFSIGKDSIGLSRGAFDNTLAVAETGFDSYVSKGNCQESYAEERYLYHKWQPMPQVWINSWIIPLGAWHIRVHKIETQREITVADGGFSNQTQSSHRGDQPIKEVEEGLIYQSPVGTVASFNVGGYHEKVIEMADPNTNLLFTQTLIPTLKSTLLPGEHILISAHFSSVSEVPSVSPKVSLETGKVTILMGQESRFV